MKKIIIAFGLCFLCGFSALAGSNSYHVNIKDIHNGYVYERIKLSNYVLPQVELKDEVYVTGVDLPDSVKTEAASNYKLIMGMERKRPFVLVRIPVYSKDPISGA
ncbi:MAG: hypothetical protein ACTHJ0_14170, partial [Flavipsychrobacter sp.]